VRPGPLANLLDLPWMLFFEMGALLVLPLLSGASGWLRGWRDSGIRLLLITGMIAIAVFPVARSNFEHNDFGQKVMLVALVAGAVMGGMAFDSWPQWRRRTRALVVLVVVLGLPISIHEAPLTAVRRWVDPHGTLARLAPTDSALFAAESAAYRFLRDELPPDAVLQPHWDHRRLKLVQIARRPLGVTALERDTRVFIGPDLGAHEAALNAVSAALQDPSSPGALFATLRAHRITHVFMGEIERTSWGAVTALSDARYFRAVYDRDGVAVIALQRSKDSRRPAGDAQ
jgi:hypothetical protein